MLEMVALGFAGEEPIEVGGQRVVPRNLLVALLRRREPTVAEVLRPAAARPPDWVKEIVTEVRGMKDGQEVTYRLGTLTCKGSLPTGVAPARTAVWLAEGRIPSGVHPPERVLDPEPFFRELEERGIYTQVSTSRVLQRGLPRG